MTPGGRVERSLGRRARSGWIRGAAKVGWHPSVRITSGVGEGLRISLRQASADYTQGTNELPVQEAMAARLRPGGVFYDVGSNIGFFAMIAARLVGPGGKSYAFEPVPANAACIRANAGRNKLANLVVLEVAVGSQSGTAPLLLTRHPGGATLSTADAPGDATTAIEVPVASLDALVEERRVEPPTVVKIDVEGLELEVLAGMAHILEVHRPTVIFELDDARPEGLAQKGEVLRDAFDRRGYDVEPLATSYAEAEWHVAHAVAVARGDSG